MAAVVMKDKLNTFGQDHCKQQVISMYITCGREQNCSSF